MEIRLFNFSILLRVVFVDSFLSSGND